jgi:hypothetical protein
MMRNTNLLQQRIFVSYHLNKKKLIMKKTILLSALFLSMINAAAFAQKDDSSLGEQHGRVLNIGVGAGYYGYVGRSGPAVMASYEIGVAKNFTLAPFIGFSSYTNTYYWGDDHRNYPYRYYSYRETIIPVGVKGAYYFDDLLKAGAKWDFYAAASLGFEFHSITWDNGYYGDRTAVRQGSSLYLAGHIGTRFHINQKVGLFLDLSTAISTFGLSINL